MTRVVVVGVEPGTLDVVATVSAECGLTVDVRPKERADSFENADEIAAFVLGEISDPLRMLRRWHAAAPSVPVLIISSEDTCRSVREAMRFTPLVGRDVDCVDRSDRERIREGVRTSIERRRRRAAMQQTIGALNRRLAQTAVPARSAVALLGRLLEIAPIGVAITDEHAIIREMNPRGATLLLHDNPSGLVGRPLADVFPAAERGRFEALLRSLSTDPPQQPREVFTSAGGGRRYQVEVTGAVLTPAAGGPGFLVLIEDTTERQGLIEQLQAANRRKDEFLAMLGHELRNPLAPIQTAVELIRARGQTPHQRELSIIERQLRHVVQLVNDLLDVARITRGKLELRPRRIELATAVTQAIEMASPLLEQRRHTLQLDVPQEGLRVDVDPPRLAQVISNLLTNAAKYTAPGGTVTVSARREQDLIVLRVRDTGRGIAPEMLPHVFDLFVQAPQNLDRAAGGLGIGLAIVRSLVELHHGTVSATSELDKGSEFTVRLPAAHEHTEADSNSPSRTEQSAGGARILVVDDNEDGAMMLADLLGTLGYVVATAHDGPSAIQLAKTFRPEVALLDIGLPVMDGYEVAARLRALPELAALKLIAITGYGQAADRARSVEFGLDAHLVKPISLRAVSEAIARVLGPSGHSP